MKQQPNNSGGNTFCKHCTELQRSPTHSCPVLHSLDQTLATPLTALLIFCFGSSSLYSLQWQEVHLGLKSQSVLYIHAFKDALKACVLSVTVVRALAM